jgi:AcrR family transcriptional regulator
MIIQIKLSVQNCTYLRDPQETKLGISIVKNSIELIDEIGFEAFTFKKLAVRTASTEASVYRYFENKQQLLLYLFSWYWAWMNYRVRSSTNHIPKIEEKLLVAMKLLISRMEDDDEFPFINERKLQQIIEQEGIKSILTKNVDAFNKAGAFDNYKNLVGILSEWVLYVNPSISHPNMLITTIIEGAHLHHFFGDHLPRLTNNCNQKNTVENFFVDMFKTLLINNK